MREVDVEILLNIFVSRLRIDSNELDNTSLVSF
jgi:hypothetical protein